jgi:hypothetical protein
MTTLSLPQRDALDRFAAKMGRLWRDKLWMAWAYRDWPGEIAETDREILAALHSNRDFLFEGLRKYRPSPEAQRAIRRMTERLRQRRRPRSTVASRLAAAAAEKRESMPGGLRCL